MDALTDIGESEGIDGRASSLDTGVRAAAAIAEHHLRRGDRVSMQVLSARGTLRVPAATGLRHLRRILDTLASVESGADVRGSPRLQHGLPPGSLVVLLSPLVSRHRCRERSRCRAEVSRSPWSTRSRAT